MRTTQDPADNYMFGVVLLSLLLTSSVSIVNFEQVNAGWDISVFVNLIDIKQTRKFYKKFILTFENV